MKLPTGHDQFEWKFLLPIIKLLSLETGQHSNHCSNPAGLVYVHFYGSNPTLFLFLNKKLTNHSILYNRKFLSVFNFVIFIIKISKRIFLHTKMWYVVMSATKKSGAVNYEVEGYLLPKSLYPDKNSDRIYCLMKFQFI